jgi:hypothetical protein
MGLDWFLLNMIVYSAVFIPLERLFAHRPDQSTFRPAWRTDLAYFFVSALAVQVTTLLTMRPAMVLFEWAAIPGLQAWVRGLPFVVQFLAILVLTDRRTGSTARFMQKPSPGAFTRFTTADDGLAGGSAAPRRRGCHRGSNTYPNFWLQRGAASRMWPLEHSGNLHSRQCAVQVRRSGGSWRRHPSLHHEPRGN